MVVREGDGEGEDVPHKTQLTVSPELFSSAFRQ